LDFPDVTVFSDIALISPSSDSVNMDHQSWHGYFTGPPNWSGIGRVLTYKAGNCPTPNGEGTNCMATVISNIHARLTAEVCYDGIDNDANGLIDKADPACWMCGDGVGE
jgi:hypothetical protein